MVEGVPPCRFSFVAGVSSTPRAPSTILRSLRSLRMVPLPRSATLRGGRMKKDPVMHCLGGGQAARSTLHLLLGRADFHPANVLCCLQEMAGLRREPPQGVTRVWSSPLKCGTNSQCLAKFSGVGRQPVGPLPGGCATKV